MRTDIHGREIGSLRLERAKGKISHRPTLKGFNCLRPGKKGVAFLCSVFWPQAIQFIAFVGVRPCASVAKIKKDKSKCFIRDYP